VEFVWEHSGRWIFKFGGIDCISDAEVLAGTEIAIPLAERATLPEGEYYHTDLAGCEVVERSSGQSLGEVESVLEYGGPALLRVLDREGREILVPFVLSICVEIDPGGRRIVVDLPEGLKDLNPAGSGKR
jgi:16S rRNA processing protein RimM